MDFKYLESEKTFCKVMKELRNHSETCENEMCKKHEWNKRNVIEVVEIGRNHDLDKSDDSSESSDSDEFGSDWETSSDESVEEADDREIHEDDKKKFKVEAVKDELED